MGNRNAIEVRDVEKAFRVPLHRVDTLKERALHPLRRIEYRELHALRGISFEVAEGEFFGIVGRNGSGKTTLLKLLASIYRADGGSIRIAGRLSPFIELGVGFNPNMSARENVLLNGVLLGLSPREARRRFDEVIEFAELGEFVEMKLKNYSSGMAVRLGFALMVQVNADVLLIDEVLAVGDAAFRRKCNDTFQRLSREGKTIVFVTHDMAAVRQFCDRAMLLEEGQMVETGSAAEVAQRYLDINLPRRRPASDGASEGPVDARITDVWVEAGSATRADHLKRGERINLAAVVEAERGIEGPALSFECHNEEGVRVYMSPPHEIGGPAGRLKPGERRQVRVSFENRLASGRYHLMWVLSRRDPPRTVEIVGDPVGLTVADEDSFSGIVELEPEWSIESDPTRELARR